MILRYRVEGGKRDQGTSSKSIALRRVNDAIMSDSLKSIDLIKLTEIQSLMDNMIAVYRLQPFTNSSTTLKARVSRSG